MWRIVAFSRMPTNTPFSLITGNADFCCCSSCITASINDRLFDELDAPVLRLSSQDIPTPYNGNLERLTIVQPEQIVEAVQKMVALRV